MPNIAVITTDWTPRSCQIASGIYDFASSSQDWTVHCFRDDLKGTLIKMSDWGPDGVITCLDSLSPNLVASLNELPLRVVSVGNMCSSFPAVIVNPRSLASLAAEYLPSELYSSVAFVETQLNHELASAFAKAFGERFTKLRLDVSERDLIAIKPNLSAAVRNWLLDHRATALIASCDQVAVYMRRAATQLDIAVPSDLAIFSLRDSLTCNLPTSSVTAAVEPAHELGFQAAKLLHRLMLGQPSPTSPLTVDATQAVDRASTSPLRWLPNIERAVRFIEQHAIRGITVSDLMIFQSTSRVTFERSFRDAVGCSPGAQIRSTRLRRAQQILQASNSSIAEIGKQCGFTTPAKFCTFFKSATGISPGKFRQQCNSVQLQNGQ